MFANMGGRGAASHPARCPHRGRTRTPSPAPYIPASLARPPGLGLAARPRRARALVEGRGGRREVGHGAAQRARRRRTRAALPERSFWHVGRVCDETHGSDDAVARVRLLGAADETARSV